MCRLYGFLANEPSKVDCTLVRAQNALLRQSHEDSLGRSHPDGWGIAYYQDLIPHVERRAKAAYEDARFSVVAEQVYARAVIAHIRKASVGRSATANTHPFNHGCWAFAHNGTVTSFERMSPQLIEETGPRLQAHRQGTTDSEQIFYWILRRMVQAGVPLDRPGKDVNASAAVVAEAVRALARRSETLGATEPARLNLTLTDGVHLVATCWKNPLHRLERHGVRECEVCGKVHVMYRRDMAYQAVVVASEPISSEPWRAVDDGTILVVDGSIGVTAQRI